MARILVAEDDPNNLELITSLLQAFGHDTIEAHDGAQAVEIALREGPDLVLMDIHMPVMDGYQAVHQLKKDSALEGIPILAITALAMVGDRDKILQAGFDGYISKPIDPESFVQQLDPYLKDRAGLARRSVPLTTGTDLRSAEPEPASPTPKGLSVMVVDDSPTNIEILRGLLEPSGYQVISASAVPEAMAKLRMNKPDLIVSDVHIPGGSGFDLIRAIKSESGLREIPFMFVSSTALRNDESRLAISLGAAKFVTRPIEPTNLLAEIEELLGSRQSGTIMPIILIVDDRPTNRELIVSLLSYRGYKVLEARDGMEALEIAKASRPNLIITDIIMPRMDGYDLVANIRSDPVLAHTPVVFYTATYLTDQAGALAQAVGVKYVLAKPSDPETIIRTVEAALGVTPSPDAPPLTTAFAQGVEGDAMTLLAKKLVERTSEVEVITFRMAAIIELGFALASEPDLLRLGQIFTDASRNIIGAGWVSVSLPGADYESIESSWSSGASENSVPSQAYKDLLNEVIRNSEPRRLTAFEPPVVRPGAAPTPVPVLAVPILEGDRAHGCACFFTKLGAPEFTKEDERIALTLGAVFASAYEKTRLRSEHERVFDVISRLAAVVESSDDAITGKTLEGIVTSWNKGAEKLYGYSAVEVLGQPISILSSPDRPEEMEQILAKIKRGERVEHYQTVRVRKDRRLVDVSLSVFPLTGAAGEVTGVASIARDITERMRAEEDLRKLNEQLEGRVLERTSQLQESNQDLEAFTYSVSHDLRAPLRHVEGFSKLLVEKHQAELSADAQEYVATIRDSVLQMATLIDDLLNLARMGRTPVSMQVTGLNSLVEEVRKDLDQTNLDRVIEWKVGTLPFVDCDPRLIKQVFANLLSNAVKYTRPRKLAIIEVGVTEQHGPRAVFVRDNGVGFNMKHASKLFGVFQRLHRSEDFEGTGVGLATVQRIIRKHGGRVWAQAELNRGATFYFTLGLPDDPTSAEASSGSI